MKARLLITAVFLAVILLALLPRMGTVLASPQPADLDEAEVQQILNATVQIAMYELTTVTASITDDGEEQVARNYAGGQGLGTVVSDGREILVLTHDHWTHLTPNLAVVEIRNAQGELLLEVTGSTFGQLIRYRDGGTMVLAAPAGLRGVIPASLGQVSHVTPGDTLLMARRNPSNGRQSVEVVSAQVEEVRTGNGPSSWQLQAQEGVEIIPGDSGGGVWHAGTVVGNLWASGVQISQGLLGRLFGTSTEMNTTTAIAAAQPLPATRGGMIAAGSPEGSQANHNGQERLEQPQEKADLLEGLLVER